MGPGLEAACGSGACTVAVCGCAALAGGCLWLCGQARENNPAFFGQKLRKLHLFSILSTFRSDDPFLPSTLCVTQNRLYRFREAQKTPSFAISAILGTLAALKTP